MKLHRLSTEWRVAREQHARRPQIAQGFPRPTRTALDDDGALMPGSQSGRQRRPHPPRDRNNIHRGFELTVKFATNVRTQCVRCRLGEDQDASSVRIRAAKAGRRCSFGSSCDRLVGRVDLSPEASTSRFLSKH